MIEESFQFISQNKIIAVIRTNQKEKALHSAYALLEGGIKIIEISFLTPGALEVIYRLRKEGVFVGVGTIMDEETAIQAVNAGTLFVISPFIEEKVIKTAIKNHLLVSAGCITPNEVIRANNLGVNLIKIFPAHGVGGVDYLKSLIDIFPHIPFMPTGGVNIDNIVDYFRIGITAVGLSTALIPQTLVQEGKYQEISKLAKQFVALKSESPS